jgi:effector protein SdbA
MRIWVPGYYILDEKKQSSRLEYFSRPFFFIMWPLTYAFKRAFIGVALGPDELLKQKHIHPTFWTDDRTEKGSVVVNLLPGKINKAAKSYFAKMSPFAPKVKQRQLSFDKPTHKAHVDSMIEEIEHLLNGTSAQDKCINKKYAIEDIHIKGLERLDARLTNYFQETIRQKHGDDFFEKDHKHTMNFYTLEPKDNIFLESVEISENEEKTKPMAERKFVIACMARNQNYMYWLKDFYTSAKNIGCTVISFNYHGLDYSTGRAWTQKDLVNDAVAQAQRLLALGVKPENIAFEGMSMGGAIATLATAKMHDMGHKVYLYNERSYRSLVRLMVGYVMPASQSNPWNPLNWLRYMLVGFTYVFVAPIIRLIGWHIDAATAWDRIPYSHKSYSVARNHENPNKYDDDDVVHDTYSSIASLMDQHRQEVKQKQKKGTLISPDEQNLLADEAKSHEFTLDRENKLNKIPIPHSAPRRFLFDTQTHTNTMHAYMIESLRLKLGIKPDDRDFSEDPIHSQKQPKL